MVVAGIGLGFVGALGAGRILTWLVEGMQPIGVWALAGTISTFIAAALLASFIPARRASRVDAMQALRQE